MQFLIVAASDEVLERARRLEVPGIVFHQVPSLAHARLALLAEPHIDAILIDAASDVARSGHVAAAGCPGTDRSDALAAATDAARARGFLVLPAEPGLVDALAADAVHDPCELVSVDMATRQLLAVARQIAHSDAGVLITGESGTGKEMLARYVHRHSRRRDQRLVSVNCAAIPENLLESELFGHEKGAFTGAVARRVGKFEEAHGGTLLLDEISEMHPRLQAKLLRAIQEREIDPLGSAAPIKVDIRLVATSNRDLEAEVAAGRFREDLWFRLNVVNLHLPPLRQRPADIVMLAGHFAARYAAINGLRRRPLSTAAVTRLRSHHWRGNVRELENCIHRAVLLATGDKIGIDDLGLHGSGASGRPGGWPPVGRTVAEVERDLILKTLHSTSGNRTIAAALLGISIRTLRNRLRQYGEEGVAVPPLAAGPTEPLARSA
ncbi:MAG TPA: sigma-54 dependent transcriptional regulator [Geminicoccaceae bacterium]|nr:sigma-54 dependent transcriptional regulator [Geminicoccaceae bacterium]